MRTGTKLIPISMHNSRNIVKLIILDALIRHLGLVNYFGALNFGVFRELS